MPVRRGETPTIFEGAMSRSKQLGGFKTSGVFDFRQTHTHAPQPPSHSTSPDMPPGSHRRFQPRHWQR